MPATIGQPLRRKEDQRLLTGGGRFSDDVSLPGESYVAFVRSPHAHARIRAIDRTSALAVPGVRAVFTHQDAPARRYSSGRHEISTDDPDDTLVLDRVIRFAGQRVAAVIADSEAVAEVARDLVQVEYDILPAVFDPEEAMRSGAPVIHDKPASSRIANKRSSNGCALAYLCSIT